ncbi:MAG: DNA mismatch repair protein MutS, partial [Thermoplasmata archaeon]
MSAPAATTPLIEQYERVRQRYLGHLVLFRVGDFYEAFGDDAKLLAHELDIQLTARGADASGHRLPMAGVPYHAVETYLARLVRKGHRVALCDQVEDPHEAKGLVRREVTRIVTPGTAIEDGILGGPDHNFLAIAHAGEDGGAWAAVDVSTGEWYHGGPEGPASETLWVRLAPFFPRELLVDSPGKGREEFVHRAQREFPRARIELAPDPLAAEELPNALRVGAGTEPAIDRADRSLAAYIRATQPRLLPVLALAEPSTRGRTLALDTKTLRHLEISRSMDPDDPAGPTLLSAWDETVSAAGRRTLSFWITHPLSELQAIRTRQDAVAALVSRGASLPSIRASLAKTPDIARIASRVAGRRVRPAEIGALRDGLSSIEILVTSLGDVSSSELL